MESFGAPGEPGGGPPPELESAIFARTRNFVAVVDADLRVWRMNAAALRLAGLADAPPPGTPFSRFAGDDDLRRLRRGLQIAAQGQVFTQVFELTGADEDEPMALSADLFALDGPPARWFAVVARNVREARRVEARLRNREQLLFQSETRLKAALFGGNQGLWDWNLTDGRLVTDALFSLIAHHGAPPPTGRAALRLVPPSTRSALMRALRRTLPANRNAPLAVEVLLPGDDGGERWLQVRGRVVERDYDGVPQRIVGTIQDVTARRALEERLRRTNTELEEALARSQALAADAQAASRAKTEFVANLSHEVRTPMNGVIGMLQLVREACGDGAPAEYAEAALRSAHGLLALLNDVLDLARFESGRATTEHVPFAPRELLAEVGDHLRGWVGARPVTVRLTCGEHVPDVVAGDPVRIRQILNNLASNAAKFTAEGEVAVAIDVAAAEDGTPRLALTVADTGIGIPEEQLDRIFDPFTQADAGTTRRYGGTGLGLAIVARIVEALNGRIEVRSRLGRGSEFRVEVPASLRPSLRPAEPPAWRVFGGTPAARRRWTEALRTAGADVGPRAAPVRGLVALDPAGAARARRTWLAVVAAGGVPPRWADPHGIGGPMPDDAWRATPDAAPDPADWARRLLGAEDAGAPVADWRHADLLAHLEGDQTLALEVGRLFLARARAGAVAARAAWRARPADAAAELGRIAASAVQACAARTAAVADLAARCAGDGGDAAPTAAVLAALESLERALEAVPAADAPVRAA